tara:strand:- start:166 stop:372 length:207 start_codon:yes stop_codon:yes gene_type:complete
MLKRLSEHEIQLCGKGNCCPIITKIDEDTYEVLDDYGNKIKVKKSELELVADAVRALDKPKDETLICG